MAVRGRDADDMIASLMKEMGQNQGYHSEQTLTRDEDVTAHDGKETGQQNNSKFQTPTPRRRLLPELPEYPDNAFQAGSQSIWNPMAEGKCGSPGRNASDRAQISIVPPMVPTNPRIEVIRRRVFEKFRQETHTLLQEFQTKNLSFSSRSSASGGSFSKNKSKLPIPSMIDKWHMDAKLEERNILFQNMAASSSLSSSSSSKPSNTSLPSAASTTEILREIATRKKHGIHVYDPILLNQHSPSIFIETILKPQVRKMWQQSNERVESNNNSEFPPKFCKKAQQVQKALFRLVCQARESFETQLLQDVRQESIRSTTAKKSRRGSNNNRIPKLSRSPTTDGDSSSPSLVRVAFSGVTLKLHPAYLEKLQRLYDRTKERRLKLEHSPDNFCAADAMHHNLSFEEALFCLLCRYDMIQGAGLQAGVPGSIMDVLLERFDCRMECFASPLNCRYDCFASAFVDVDAAFGSKGSFFELPLLSDNDDGDGNDTEDDDSLSSRDGGICYEANPPFCEGLIQKLSETIDDVLSPQRARNHRRPIMFVVFVPAWRESGCYQALLANERLEGHLLLEQGDHWYAEGTQHRRRDSFRVASFDTSVLFYQNVAAKRLWNVKGKDAVVLDELAKAFGQDPGNMQKENQTILPQGRRTKPATGAGPSTPAVLPVIESNVGNPPLSTEDRKESISTSQTELSSSTRKQKKASTKEKKRKWNQQDEGKAQLNLLASLGLSSTTKEGTADEKSKPATSHKSKRKKKIRRKK